MGAAPLPSRTPSPTILGRPSSRASRAGARQHELDWLRSLAILAVFAQHLLNAYATEGWLGVRQPPRPRLASLLEWTVYWRMPLMFFIAGHASVLALTRKRLGAYLVERAEKLGVPLLAGLLLLVPPQLYVRAHLSGRLGSTSLLGAISPITPEGIQWSHLWFVSVLLVLTIAQLPLVLVMRRHGARIGRSLGGRAGRTAALYLLALPPLAAAAFRTRWVAWLDLAWLIDVQRALSMGGFFVGGIVVASVPGLGAMAERRRRWSLLLWAGLTAALSFVEPVQHGDGVHWQNVVRPLGNAGVAWLWVLTTYGFARRHLRFSTRSQRWFAGVSYAFYLVHQPVILGVAAGVLMLSLPVWAEAPLLAVTAFATTLVLCRGIESTGITRFLFGLRRVQHGAPRDRDHRPLGTRVRRVGELPAA